MDGKVRKFLISWGIGISIYLLFFLTFGSPMELTGFKTIVTIILVGLALGTYFFGLYLVSKSINKSGYTNRNIIGFFLLGIVSVYIFKEILKIYSDHEKNNTVGGEPPKVEYVIVFLACWVFGGTVSTLIEVESNLDINLNLFLIGFPLFLLYYMRKNFENIRNREKIPLIIVAILVILIVIGFITSIYQTLL